MPVERPPRVAVRLPPLARWGTACLALVVAAALAAPLLAPYDPAEQTDPAAARHRPPGTSLIALRLADGGWLLGEELDSAGDPLRLHRLGRWQEVPRSRVVNLDGDRVADRRLFLLGSDRLGRDVLSRILWGARLSLGIGALAAALALTLGLAVGGIAGFAGGWIDSALMRFTDAMLSLPRLFLLLTAAALLDFTTGLLVVLLGGTSWMAASRLVRAEIRAARGRDYVAAARAAGLPRWRILTSHLLPAALTPVIVDTTLRVGDLILIEAALSFLGLGVPPPAATWGGIVADGRDVLVEAWWVAAFPGSALLLTVVGLNMLGDGLRDRLDPRAPVAP